MSFLGFLDVTKRPGRRDRTDVSASDPLPVTHYVGGSAVSSTNPQPTKNAGNFQTAKTPQNIVPTTASQQLAPANAARRYGVMSNGSSVTVYVLFGAGPASATAYAIVLTPNMTYELPAGLNTAIQIIAAAAGATGTVGFQDVQD